MGLQKHDLWQFDGSEVLGVLSVDCRRQLTISTMDNTLESVCALLGHIRLKKAGKTICVEYLTKIDERPIGAAFQPQSIVVYLGTDPNGFQKIIKSSTCAEHLPQVGLFLRQQTGQITNVYYSKIQQTAFVLISHAFNYAIFHLLAACLPQLAPWLFENDPLTEEEKNLLRGISQGCSAGLAQQWHKLIQSDSFRQDHLSTLVSGFANDATQKQLDALEAQKKKFCQQMQDALREIRSLQEQLDNCGAQYMTLQQRLLSDENTNEELLRFFCANKQIKVISRDTNRLHIEISTYLDYIDEEMYDHFIKKSICSVYTTNNRYSVSEMKSFYKALWEDRRFKLRVWASMDLVSNGTLLFRKDRCRDNHHMNQPHLVAFGCVGTYAEQLAEAEKNGDHIAALSTALAVVRSLTLSDGVVGQKFVNDLTCSPGSDFIVTEDGRSITFDQAMTILREEQNK